MIFSDGEHGVTFLGQYMGGLKRKNGFFWRQVERENGFQRHRVLSLTARGMFTFRWCINGLPGKLRQHTA